MVRDRDTGDGSDTDYFLDTPPAFVDAVRQRRPPVWLLGRQHRPATFQLRTFSAGPTTSAGVLKDPLWYAAKWGGFKDANANNLPDLASEWDEDNNGVPDNYFLVTNALTLADRSAAPSAKSRAAGLGILGVGQYRLDLERHPRVPGEVQIGDWTGQLLSYPGRAVDNPLTPANEIGTLAPVEWTAWQR